MWLSAGGIFSAWYNRVVPVAVERVAGEVDGGQLNVGNFDGFWIFVFIQFSAHFEAGLGCRRGDQLDNCAIAAQRFTPPVDGYERKETMLDFVPLAGAGRQMANRNGSLSSSASF